MWELSFLGDFWAWQLAWNEKKLIQLYDNIFLTTDIDLSLKYKEVMLFYCKIKSPIASPIRKCFIFHP